MRPGQLLFDPGTPCHAHFAPPRFVVDQIDQQLRQLADVVRSCIDSCVGRREAGLAEIERNDR